MSPCQHISIQQDIPCFATFLQRVMASIHTAFSDTAVLFFSIPFKTAACTCASDVGGFLCSCLIISPHSDSIIFMSSEYAGHLICWIPCCSIHVVVSLAMWWGGGLTLAIWPYNNLQPCSLLQQKVSNMFLTPTYSYNLKMLKMASAMLHVLSLNLDDMNKLWQFLCYLCLRTWEERRISAVFTIQIVVEEQQQTFQLSL